MTSRAIFVLSLTLSLTACARGGFTPVENNGVVVISNNTVPNNGTTTNNESTNNGTVGVTNNEPGTNNGGPRPEPPFDVDEPMTVVQEGTRGLLLHGTVLAPTGPIPNGQVLVLGKDIVCVGTDCTADVDAADATWIATGGVISPGLIDAHNHLPYNFLPEWESPQLFENRYQWSDDPAYEAHVAPFSTHRSSGSHYCPSAKWGELRSLIHATTTIQGQSANQSCIRGGARNADHEHDLQYDHLRTTIVSPRDITDDQAQNFIDSIDAMPEPITRIAIHMTEGYAGDNVLDEFASWAGRDTRDNRHAGQSLLYKETSILIHGVGLTESELDEVAETNSKMVWSPSSNIVLYGRTAPIEEILARDIVTGIGPDWTISGEDDMLAELRYASDYAAQEGITVLTPRKLWEMATDDGATVLGVDGFVGRLEVGYRADLAVFGKSGSDPYQAVISSRAEDVQLVLVDGEAYYGAGHLRERLGRNSGCEPFDACGVEKFLCVVDLDIPAGDEDYDMVRQKLVDILEGTGYPADEQYGRGEDLLPLVACD